MEPPMHRRFPVLTFFLLAILLLLLSGCATGTGTGVISGSVLFLDREPPPAGELVFIEIYTLADIEKEPVLLASAFVPTTGMPVLPFAVAYDKAQIVPKDIYTIQASITGSDEHRTWFSGFWNVILTQGRPTEEIELRLRPVAGG
jgi:uncharacterized lipoprotein YbaY